MSFYIPSFHIPPSLPPSLPHLLLLHTLHFFLPSFPLPLKSIVCSSTGWSGKAAKTIRRLIELYPEELDLWNDLGVKYLMMANNEDARLAFQRVCPL